MRITRVYTRNGDRGSTSLVGGQTVPKSHIRINAFGDVDELNSVIGHIRQSMIDAAENATLNLCAEHLFRIQNDLFRVGADLATLPADRWEGMERIRTEDTTWLESLCDEYNAELPALKEFILPGGGPISCWCHTARTVCRRAERNLVLLESEEEGSAENALPYLNRLSDFFFVLARWVAKETGHRETMWQRRS